MYVNGKIKLTHNYTISRLWPYQPNSRFYNIEMKFIKLIVTEVVEKEESNWFDRMLAKLLGTSSEARKIERVDYWYLEVDVETGKVQREIGFIGSGEPIIFFPSEHNHYGFWADSPSPIEFEEYEQISTREFDQIWQQLNLRLDQ